MTLEEKVHGLRLHVIRRAQELGNVSQACRDAGISRALFYRWQKRLERYGVDGVHPRRQQARAGRPVQLAPETERLLLSVAVSAATWGGRPHRRLPAAAVGAARSAEYGATGPAARGPGHATPAAHGARGDRARHAGMVNNLDAYVSH